MSDARRPTRRLAARWHLIHLTAGLNGPDWLIGVVFACGLAFLGAALGVLPNLGADGWSGSPGQLVWLYGFGVGAALSLTAGAVLWWQRNRILRRRGTAYIIEEQGPGWDFEEKQTFLSAVRGQFAAIRHVPGPAHLGADWNWPLRQRTGEWERRVDELMRYFWATHFNDNQETANALYIWAPWPVATAFGTRASTGRRGLVVHIRQRPSYGRLRQISPAGFTAPGHTFLPGGPHVQPAGTFDQDQQKVRLQVRRPDGDQQGSANPTADVVILLLRTSTRTYGPLPAVGAPPPEQPLTFDIVDGAGLGLPTTASATLYEWRYLPRGGDAIGWDEYPALVEHAAAWICQQALAHPTATLLLGAAVPQEIATGLGIHATTRSDWPEYLWPMVYADDVFTTPNVNLGRTPGG